MLVRLCTCSGVRSCRDWCRYRYIFRPRRLLGRGGCRPKQIQFPLRGRLKLSEKWNPRTCPTSGLEVSYGYGLLILVRFLVFCYIRNSDIFIIKHIIPNLFIKFFCGHLLRYFKCCIGTRKLIT